ncbi:DoxX family protein [Tomitella biformata]|uniref:DoxX family protein n=1 Tax=Tomitella biformata TaxID=630403 RepID=UPI0004666C26|nr:DoxX family protein [Tomitella biformata]
MDSIDTGLLILRVCLGLTMAAHGYGKLCRGGRIPGTARWFESIGMRPGLVHAWLAAATEVAAGLALALGLLTPFAAAGFVALMFVAAWTVHRGKGFFIAGDGWEYNLVLATGAAVVAIAGPGAASLDHLFFGDSVLAGWAGGLIAVLGGLAGAGILLGTAYRPEPAAAAEPAA